MERDDQEEEELGRMGNGRDPRGRLLGEMGDTACCQQCQEGKFEPLLP